MPFAFSYGLPYEDYFENLVLPPALDAPTSVLSFGKIDDSMISTFTFPSSVFCCSINAVKHWRIAYLNYSLTQLTHHFHYCSLRPLNSYSRQQCLLESSSRPANHPGLFISSVPGFVVFSISNVKKVAVVIAIGIVLNDPLDYFLSLNQA